MLFLILPDFSSPLGNLSVTNCLRDSPQIPRTAAFFAMGFATAGRPKRCVAGKPIGDPFCRQPIASLMRKTKKMRLRFGFTRTMSGYRAHLRHYCGLKHRNCLCTTTIGVPLEDLFGCIILIAGWYSQSDMHLGHLDASCMYCTLTLSFLVT